jgi:hypothetical protein
MSRHFNKLTPAEAELLALLAEECGEVVQVIGKILRHGLESTHPNAAPIETNRYLLQKECGDLWAAMDLLAANGVIDSKAVAQHSTYKLRRVFQYLHHNKQLQSAEETR